MSKDHDTVGFWLETAGKYPLLPKHEMLRLARIIQDPKSSEQKKHRAVNKLVLHNLKLIPKAARKFTGCKRSYNFGDCNTVDLMQAGVFGLKRAAEKYDPSRGYAFSTYAMPWIKQSLQRYAYANLSNIRVPESTLRDVFNMTSRVDREKPKDMCPLKWNRITDAYFALNINSLDAKVDNKHHDDCNDMHEAIASKTHYCPESKHTFDEILSDVEISDEDRLILYRYYIENTKHSDIAKELGKSTESIRYRASRAVRKIRQHKSLK